VPSSASLFNGTLPSTHPARQIPFKMVKRTRAINLDYIKQQHINVFRIPEELLKVMSRHEEEMPDMVDQVNPSMPAGRMVDSEGNFVPACSKCGIEFGAAEKDKQRAHFRSDWHRYNVKRSLEHSNVPAVSEQQFQDMLEGKVLGKLYMILLRSILIDRL
jgi:hypothetical protein